MTAARRTGSPPYGSEAYHRRIARGEAMGLTRSQTRGHAKRGEVPASKVEKTVTILGATGATEVTAIGAKERSRAAKYDNDVQRLLDNKLAPSAFDRRWKGKSIGGVALLDWREAVALGQQGLASFDTFYPSRTP
jgi:hypothetical protein